MGVDDSTIMPSRLLHLSKAYAPMVSTDAGIVMLVSFVQARKAIVPMLLIPFGNVML